MYSLTPLLNVLSPYAPSRYLADVAAAMQDRYAPSSYETFVPLGKRNFARSSTSLLFSPLLYLGKISARFITEVSVRVRADGHVGQLLLLYLCCDYYCFIGFYMEKIHVYVLRLVV